MSAAGGVESPRREAAIAQAGPSRPATERRMSMFMAFHSTARSKPFLIAAAASLLLLGIGVGIAFG
jgi:hypothetical protein